MSTKMVDFLCLLLILFPFRLPVPTICPALIPPLQRVAYALEIACPGAEVWSQTRFGNELTWCRYQWRTARHLPALGHAAVWPPLHECEGMSRWWSDRACWLEHERMLRPWLDVQDSIGEARGWARYWTTAATARDASKSARSRREAIAELWGMEWAGR